MATLAENLVAPCGMNCGVCRAYLAYSRRIPKERGKITHCAGCRIRNKQCAYIKENCEQLRHHEIQFCFECADFPCHRLRTIDQRYRTRYDYSLIGNLEEVKESGMAAFLQR